MRVIITMMLCIIADTSDTFDTPILAQTQPPPSATWSPAPNVGTCTRCGNWNWVNGDSQACQTFTCLGPGWPDCANQQPRGGQVCTPGSRFEVTACGATGVQSCAYVCNAQGTGYAAPICQTIGNGGNFRRTYCDYSAGCAVEGGFVQGRPTTIAQQCTQDGVLQTVTRGACGAGGCLRKLVCKPGQPCCRPGIDPGCTPQCTSQGSTFDIQPRCGPNGAGYSCTFGKLTLSVAMPCPSVLRKPFPRAIVGQPVQLQIANACGGLPNANGRVDVPPPYDQCGDEIFAYEGQIGWMCSRPDLSDAEWRMDERPWNIGHTSALGPISNVRTGVSINHIYETSSYDLAPNGPGYPDLAKRLPAYQVQLQTHYTLAGTFQYHYRTRETQCYWGPDGTGGRKQCANPGNCLSDPNAANREDCKPDGSRMTVIVSPTRTLPSFVIPDIAVTGAKTPQDLVNPNSCGVIAVPVIMSQAVLVP